VDDFSLSASRSSGANGPAAPFPASITIFSGRFLVAVAKFSSEILLKSSFLYRGQMSWLSNRGAWIGTPASSSTSGSSKSSSSISL